MAVMTKSLGLLGCFHGVQDDEALAVAGAEAAHVLEAVGADLACAAHGDRDGGRCS
jgi:hypothetical protein